MIQEAPINACPIESRRLRIRRKGIQGVGLLEFLIALLIFSVGMTGLVSSQLVSKRLAHEALQRSVATTLVRELLERIQANPAEVDRYAAGLLDTSATLPEPPSRDCRALSCQAAQMAVFDLWQWQSWLRGSAELRGETPIASLPQSRACITQEAGQVTVSVSWRGASEIAALAGSVCGDDGAFADAEVALSHRRQVSLTSFVGD